MQGISRTIHTETQFDTLSPSEWDAIVIGAGPGGSVAASLLARRGHSVLLVDRATMPRAKVCGCCLAPAGADALRAAGLRSVLDGSLSVNSCAIHAGRRAVRLSIRTYLVIDRATMDHRLARSAADAGARLILGCNARVRADGAVTLHHAGSADAPPPAPRLTGRVVLVADGLAGTSLDDLSEFAWRIRPTSRMGIGATLSQSPMPLARGEMTMLTHRSGYLGLVRLPSGAIDAAAALDPRAIREFGGPATLIAEIIEACGGDARVCDGARWRGAPLLTRRRSRVESEGIMVLGDAAGYVEPFTGEGMTWAILDAVAAAAIASDRIRGRVNAGAWSAHHARSTWKSKSRCAAVAGLTRHQSLLGLTLRGMSRFPPLGQAAARLLAPSTTDHSRVLD